MRAPRGPGGLHGGRRYGPPSVDTHVVTNTGGHHATGVVFALVHFTVGFVLVLAVLSVVPRIRYRLTGAYLGGIWALVPDGHHVVDGALGAWLHAVHDGPQAGVFFFHGTLDTAGVRARNLELTFLSLVALGVAFLAYDWASGRRRSVVVRMVDGDASDDSG